MAATPLPIRVVRFDPSQGDAAYADLAEACVRIRSTGRDPVVLVRSADVDHVALAAIGAEVVLPAGSELPTTAGSRVLGTWRSTPTGVVLHAVRADGAVATPVMSPALPVGFWAEEDEPDTDAVAAHIPDSGSGSRKPTAVAIALVAIGIALVAGSMLNAPYVVVKPGGSGDVTQLVESGPPVAHAGSLHYVYVRTSTPSWLTTPYWHVRSKIDAEVVPRDTAYGPKGNEDLQRPVADAQVPRATANAASAKLAGERVRVVGKGAEVRSVSPTSSLRIGDRIVELEGTKIATLSDTVPVLSKHIGDTVEASTATGRRATITVGADPTREHGYTLDVLLADLPATVTTSGDDVTFRRDMPFAGGSAGLTMALYAYEARTGIDVTRGRTIYATGLMDTAGNVGHVAGVAQKAVVAERDGADVFLVPRATMAEAGRFVSTEFRSRIVAVDTLEDAVEALRASWAASEPTGPT